MSKAKRNVLVLLWLGAAWISISTSLASQEQADVLYFNRLSTNDSLTAQSNNFYIYKDAEAFVWISSTTGLNRYDGRTVRPYRHTESDPYSLAHNNVQSMFFEDAANDLWFTSYRAIHRYDRTNDRFTRHYLLHDGDTIRRGYRLLHIDRQRRELWVAVNKQLFLVPIGENRDTVLLDTFPLNHLSQVVAGKTPSEHYLITTDELGLHLIRFRDRRVVHRRRIRLDQRFPGIRLFSFFFENERRLWVGSNRGLLLAEGTEPSIRPAFSRFNGVALTDITGIAPAPAGKLLVATKQQGLFYFDTTTFRYTRQIYQEENGQVKPFLLAIDKIYFDRDQTLWVSTAGQGIYFTHPQKKKFRAYLQNPTGGPMGINNVKAMSQDRQGRIWCLTKSGIVVLDEDGRPLPGFDQLRAAELAFAADEPFYILCDRNGRVWVSTQRGLYVLPAGERSFQKVPAEASLRQPGFIFICQLANGRILTSAAAGGIFEVEQAGERYRLRPVPELADLADVSWMYEDAQNERLFLCRYNAGISTFRHQGRRFLPEAEATFSPVIHTLSRDRNGADYWLATSQGLYRATFRDGRLALTQEPDDYPRQALIGLLQDTLGRVWASTERGLLRYHPQRKETRVFRVSEGLQAPEFNFWSFLETREGRFAFGGVNGLNLFDPLHINDMEVAAHPVITHLMVHGAPLPGLLCADTRASQVSQMRKINLKYSQRTLSFYFAPREYSDPDACRMTYQLIGVDEKPVVSGPDRFARYAKLKPRSYVFEVRATNSDGVEAPHVARLAITIKPPWWQTWYFYAFCVLMIFAIGYRWYRSRIRKIQREAEELRKAEEFRRREAEFRQKEAEFRQKEAELKQQAAETETAVLRLQMKPHFIFNSMNSISSYLLQKDVDTANNYLNRFSKLMRMILDLSVKPVISISTECELLEQYLRTEAMRLENRFTHHFEVEDELDPEETVVPTMILQPFVENAIWHGLSGKKGQGHIRIAFRREKGNGLCCIVEDDGIGRAAVAAKASPKVHESKALSITTRRLELLKIETQYPAAYEIIDLYDETGRPAGTRVVLHLPLL